MSDTYTYSATKSRSYSNGAGPEGEPEHAWSAEEWIRQGEFVTDAQYGPYYGTFYFGSGAGTPTELSGRTIQSAQIYVKRMTSGGSGTDPFTVYATTLTDVPGSGAASPAGNTSGAGTLVASLALGAGGWYALPAALAQAAVNGFCLCIYSGSTNYARLEGADSPYRPQIEITCAPQNPNLTAPALSGIASPIASASPSFVFGASSDLSGMYPASELYYEMQLSADGGSSWGGAVPGDNLCQTSAQGAASFTPDLLAFLTKTAGQFYYNGNFKIRIRAKTPAYNGTNYYSGYATSDAFAVDYRLGLSAPSFLTPSSAAPYEGQTGATYGVKFTLGVPAAYNSKDSAGNTMGLTYYIKYNDDTAIQPGGSDVTATVNDATKTSAWYTAPSKSTDLDDYANSIKAYAIDSEGQISPYKSNISFTIRRFRTPVIMITGITRTATAATVAIKVADTGYGVSGQLYANLYSMGGNGCITYNIGAGYMNSTLGAWSGLTNTFTISGLTAGTRYTLNVKVRNAAPSNTGLTDLVSDAATSTIYEYVPTIAVMKDSNPGTGAANILAAQAMIVTDDFSTAVDLGYVVAKNGVKVGSTSVKLDRVSAARKVLGRTTAGDGAIEEVAMLGNTNSVVMAGAAGTSGHLASWDSNGNIADSGISTSIPENAIDSGSETGNGTKLVTASAAGASGNLVAWDANGNAADAALAAAAAVKCVNRQNDTTNTTISNQTVKMGWGFIQGSSYTAIGETIIFDSSFDDVPIVVANYIGLVSTSGGTPSTPSNFSSGGTIQMFGYASAASANQFTLIIANRDASNLSSSYYYGYSWIAIGTKSR